MSQQRSSKSRANDGDHPVLALFFLSFMAVCVLGVIVSAVSSLWESKPPTTITLHLEHVSSDGNWVLVALQHARSTDWFQKSYTGSTHEGPKWRWGDGIDTECNLFSPCPYGPLHAGGTLPPNAIDVEAHFFAPREGRRNVCVDIVHEEWSSWRNAWVNQEILASSCLQLPPPKFD